LLAIFTAEIRRKLATMTRHDCCYAEGLVFGGVDPSILRRML